MELRPNTTKEARMAMDRLSATVQQMADEIHREAPFKIGQRVKMETRHEGIEMTVTFVIEKMKLKTHDGENYFISYFGTCMDQQVEAFDYELMPAEEQAQEKSTNQTPSYIRSLYNVKNSIPAQVIANETLARQLGHSQPQSAVKRLKKKFRKLKKEFKNFKWINGYEE